MPIEIVPYDPTWPERFEWEVARMRGAFGDEALRIEHVGSTSVPGLAAKDVVDIQVSVRSLQAEEVYRGPLERLGYVHRPDDEPGHRFFKLVGPGGRRLVNVHICEAGGEWESRHIAFRNHLRANPGTAAEYERVKRRLAPRFDDANEYADAKGDFIRSVESAARSGAPT